MERLRGIYMGTGLRAPSDAPPSYSEDRVTFDAGDGITFTTNHPLTKAAFSISRARYPQTFHDRGTCARSGVAAQGVESAAATRSRAGRGRIGCKPAAHGHLLLGNARNLGVAGAVGRLSPARDHGSAPGRNMNCVRHPSSRICATNGCGLTRWKLPSRACSMARVQRRTFGLALEPAIARWQNPPAWRDRKRRRRAGSACASG